jgi:hypothetical protein
LGVELGTSGGVQGNSTSIESRSARITVSNPPESGARLGLRGRYRER